MEDVVNRLVNTDYKNIVIIGFGKIATDVLTFTIKKRPCCGYTLEFIEFESYPTSIIKRLCAQSNVNFYQLHDKKLVTEKLETYDQTTLIISAGNKYLFPERVLQKKNIRIINFHNALLPEFPGRNAPTWAIYSGKELSGATWHWVNTGIDEGDCLWQKSCPITEDMKAYELTKRIMELAYEGFEDIFEDILQNSVKAKKQDNMSERRMYYSWEIPGNGVFSIQDNPKDIYRLLRATDYGINRIFPRIKCGMKDGASVEIINYKKILHDPTVTEVNIDSDKKIIYLPYNQEFDLRLKYKAIEI